MRTISYKLDDLKKIVIPIGFEGENDHTRVIIDAGEVFAQYPSAAASLRVKPPQGSIYPVVVNRDGDRVIWNVKDTDCASDGNGEAQFTFTENNVIVKSVVTKIKINRSLTATGPAPDPIQDWLDTAEDVLEEIQAAEVNQPTIGEDGYWYTWNQETGEYEKTETKAQGADGQDATPDLITKDYEDLTFPVTAGTQCYHDGLLYYAKQDIQTAEAWTAAHWQNTTVEEQVTELKTAIHGMNTATASDVGKALSPKTVADGEVTEWKFVSVGGGGSVETDKTLTEEDVPADSKAVGDIFRTMIYMVHDPSTNFIDYAKVEEGYIKSDGTIRVTGSWHNTGKVYLEAGKQYYSNGLYTGSSGYYAFYNDNDIPVEIGSSELPNPFTVPAGATYGRFSKNGNITTGVWIAETNSEPSAYGLMEYRTYVEKEQGAINAGKLLSVGTNGKVEIKTKSEADITGLKLWEKGNLYKANELIAGKYIYKDGSENTNNSYSCTPFLPVHGTVYLWNGWSYTYYAFYDANKHLVASYNTLGDLQNYSPGIKYVTVPNGAVYARFSFNGTSPASYAFITCKPENPHSDDWYSVDGVFPYTLNPANPCDYSGNSVGVFHKCACVGDSLTYGTFDYDENPQINTPNMETLAGWYSYPSQFTKLTGIETVNLGDASETWKTWYEAHGSYDYTGCDAVIIHLGVNDAAKGKSDEETEEYMIELINTIKASVMHIKIFVCTLTPQFSNDRFPAYPLKSQLIRDVYEANYGRDPDVFLLDMETYSHVRQFTSYVAGHMTALGYQRWAQDCANYISWIIDNNMRDFRFVQFIGSDRTFSGD